MPGNVLLDTSILVALLRGDPAVEDHLKVSDEASTSVVALGELYYGVRRSTRFAKNRHEVDQLAATLTAIPCDRLTAEVYSRLKNQLRERGRQIPDNDLWIAATAVQHGLQLISRDDHFLEIGDLVQDRW